MKLMVLGNSDTDGSRLERRDDAWPYLIAEQVREATGQEVEVAHKLLFAGPTAAGYVQRQLDAEHPDVVVLATSTYGVVLQLVSNRVNEKFGPRAARVAARAEQLAAEATYRLGPVGSRPLIGLRKLARRLIGTRPALSMEGMLESYAECMSVLARAENVETIVLSGPGYTMQHAALNPKMLELQAKATVELKRSAERHHFAWESHEALMGGVGAKDRYFLADGVHTGVEAHRVVAEAIGPLVVERV